MNKIEIKKINNESMLKEALDIRDTVFTKEKNVPKEIEVDEYDKICTHCDHFLIVYNSINIGTIRCLKINDETIKIQRFCFLKDYRNLGLGRKTLKYIENYYKNKKIIMDAKYQVSGFYEKCGYQKISEVFIEAGIEHVKMMKDVRIDE